MELRTGSSISLLLCDAVDNMLRSSEKYSGVSAGLACLKTTGSSSMLVSSVLLAREFANLL